MKKQKKGWCVKWFGSILAKKHNFTIVLIPTFGYVRDRYGRKPEHNFGLMWLCFSVGCEIRYES